MRVFASCAAIALCAACGPSDSTAPQAAKAAPSMSSVLVNPARVDRVRSAVPTDYEFSALPPRAAPIALWGLGPDWTSDPAPCGALADPAGNGTVHGWSASGPGGIVYAAVADAPVTADPHLVDSCPSWHVSAGHTGGVVGVVGSPVIDGAQTLGLATDATTTVEGGIETRSHVETVIAYLGEHIAYVAVVTDPGSSAPALAPGFAADLLVKTVAAIRG